MLKNAIDYLYAEWNNKAMGVVSYGSALDFGLPRERTMIMGSHVDV